MTTLVSPGVSIPVIDESAYATAGIGTIPLFVIATAANKTAPSGTGTAPYTTSSYANKLYLATSQRDLAQQFGIYSFQNVEGTPIHGSELNEYGLHAAYSYLGLSNRAYVLRANIDVSQLAATTTAPTTNPAAGTYWLDTTSNTSFGIFKANGGSLPGSAWVKQTPLRVQATDTILSSDVYYPKTTVGVDGNYAIVVSANSNFLFERVSGEWYQVGTAAWKAVHPTVLTSIVNPATIVPVDGTHDAKITLNGTVVDIPQQGLLSDVATAITSAAITNITAAVVGNQLVITNTAGGAITIANNAATPLTQLGITAGTYNGVSIVYTNDASWPSGIVAGSVWMKGTSPNGGAKWAIKFFNGTSKTWVSMTAPLYPFNSQLADGNSSKDTAAFAGLGVPTTGNLYIGYDATTGAMTPRRWNGTVWQNLTYVASITPPSSAPADGTMWFNQDFKVDIMVGDGQYWHAYHTTYPSTDPEGVIISGSAPYSQTDSTELVDNDIWLDSSDLENYPALYRYNATTGTWKAIDNTDQTTPFGIIFADARQDSGVEFTGIPNASAYAYNSTAMVDMLISDYVDPDAPDPRTHPAGMILFNTRYSNNNVKEYQSTYFKPGGFSPTTDYTAGTYTVGGPDYVFPALASATRWVTASGNANDGSPYMGRKAQRQMIVRAMAGALNSNEDIRSEAVYFSLLLAPGYPELLSEMINLNTDQGQTSFIIGDTPCRLTPNGTSIQNWATNANNVPDNGDKGLTASDVYTGIYYPWGLTTDLSGNAIMIPPSSIAVNVFAYSDSVSYPWFAPAGFKRGMVHNASSVGYLNSESEYVPVSLNQGQRDVMYINKINPIAYIPTRGLVVYGQKTLNPIATALDRVNVARLINYIKYNLNIIMKVFLFEQNDDDTRHAAKILVERFFTNLVTTRAIYDFVVVCDTTNNTGDRIDRNELWVDCLISPEKSIEFIYVPIRIENTGADLVALANRLTQ